MPSEVAHASASVPTTAEATASVRRSRIGRYSLLRLSVTSSTVAAIAGLLLWPTSTPKTLTMMATPTIAVLPFRTVDAADENGHTIGTGSIGELLRSELARSSPGLDLAIKSAVGQETLRSLASDKDLRYLVLGTTWQQQRTQHINVQLTEVDSGEQIWAQAFSFNHDQAEAQSRLAALIARQIGVKVRHTEARRPLPELTEAGHLALQGFALLESERGSQLHSPSANSVRERTHHRCQFRAGAASSRRD